MPGSCENPVEIDVTNGVGWSDQLWTNELPAFTRPLCPMSELPVVASTPWRALVFRFVMPHDGWARMSMWSQGFDAALSNSGCSPCRPIATCTNVSGTVCGTIAPTPSLPKAPFPVSLPYSANYLKGGDEEYIWFQPAYPDTAPTEGRIVVNVIIATTPF
jgi:hypothetical protein